MFDERKSTYFERSSSLSFQKTCSGKNKLLKFTLHNVQGTFHLNISTIKKLWTSEFKGKNISVLCHYGGTVQKTESNDNYGDPKWWPLCTGGYSLEVLDN